METKDELQEISPDLNAKMKKNLLWIFMFAVFMIFAGLTSGYIVSQGGSFWVNVRMPSAFQVSTGAIIASSIFLIIARRAVKQDKMPLVKLSLGAALVLGGIFGYAQVLGWGQLIESGNTVSDQIINVNGKYGKYFTLYYQEKEISFDNGTFYMKGEPISDELLNKMKAISEEFMEGAKDSEHNYNLTGYGNDFILRYDGELITYSNNALKLSGVNLSGVQHGRLWYFAENIVNDRGDFIMKGKYGEDFVIYYQGEMLDYTNRTFYLNGQLLSPKKMNDLNSQKNTASSYIYAFTFVHLLHWIGGVIALLVMFIKGLRIKYNSENYLGITLGSIYWHFLGILWLYLYAFLIFIH